MKRVTGSILFWVVMLGALAYGIYAFYNRPPNPEEVTPLPQKVQTQRQEQSAPPMKAFEKQMEERVERSKDRGVDLTKPKEKH
ncbi:hypothetical protein COW36_17360 [bacterium (Candidatus Blackallbacteria) CG17_big_fil_post_rev_8_21_14_2_50_48_46]|uniref:Uncharacterized protein n=1 Tax=bacterium (Candidatus Blackallbacteria) CG17_big_fil_post_rev_8_21_14_2_50_48_46 TaxID=2014261 RepID=A0A2M7G1I3_9BACT|nr:MAG: hypothetical protein COW64_01370 [bacterium (Candidatus Blackallbacteria) CG18_big_fil_WC_8_21_14_2_50_49_26]PIW15190.1 MAG: hypothetical protein COW36_17360 [bacterium (Candidatus Blackallbacteria) CG17_big_fil_post_rev_8_21_14_2_50_48_46]PIW44777.1 MAG: hypothetical protein COW20_22695 [bacterium (Candidatus Blackallbacteria) CG13_big_fil_rev_8_21_14_2_50_49_14]